jgi:hypothetical protein
MNKGIRSVFYPGKDIGSGGQIASLGDENVNLTG